MRIEKTMTIVIKCQFDEVNNIRGQSIHFENEDGLNNLEIIGIIESFKIGFINDIDSDKCKTEYYNELN